MPPESVKTSPDYIKIVAGVVGLLITIFGSNYGLEHFESQEENRAAQIIANNETQQTTKITELEKQNAIKTSQINLLKYQLTDALRRIENLED